MTLTIKIDSRKQLPYQFEIPSEVGTIPIGDYSICGLENNVAVERKTLDDLISCLTAGRNRFGRELFKGRSLDYFCLVLECSLSDLVNGRYRSEMNPKSAVQSLLAFSIRYRLPIWFCESRSYAQRVTESLLCKYVKEVEKVFNHIQGGE